MEWKSSESIKSNVNKIYTSKYAMQNLVLFKRRGQKVNMSQGGKRPNGKQTVSTVYLKAEISHQKLNSLYTLQFGATLPQKKQKTKQTQNSFH